MKLKAFSVSELHMISGLVQGSIFRLNMCKINSEKFTIHNFNRFMWEKIPDLEQTENLGLDQDFHYERIHSSLSIYNLSRCVIPAINKQQFLMLLAIVVVDYDHLRIYCANMVTIELYLNSPSLEIYMEDYGVPWPTANPPFMV